MVDSRLKAVSSEQRDVHDVASGCPESTITVATFAAIRIMMDHGLTSLPVRDDECRVGIVRVEDLMPFIHHCVTQRPER